MIKGTYITQSTREKMNTIGSNYILLLILISSLTDWQAIQKYTHILIGWWGEFKMQHQSLRWWSLSKVQAHADR